MAVLTRDTQDQYVAMRPYRAGICLLDTSSAVCHIPAKSFYAASGATQRLLDTYYSPMAPE